MQGKPCIQKHQQQKKEEERKPISKRENISNCALHHVISRVKIWRILAMEFLFRLATPCPASSSTSIRLWRPPPPLLLSVRACSASPPPPLHPDYLSLSDKELFAQCSMDTFRASGPGGQHRNKTESAVRLTHNPTGLISQASDDRSQHKNRAYALDRLRNVIAAKVRRPVEIDEYKPPSELVRILPIGKGSKDDAQRIGPNHPDFPKGVQCLLDLLLATEGSVSAAAGLLGMSTGSLSKVLVSHRTVLVPVNELRASKGLKPLH